MTWPGLACVAYAVLFCAEAATNPTEQQLRAQRDAAVLSAAVREHAAAEQKANETMWEIRKHMGKLKLPANVDLAVNYVQQCAQEKLRDTHVAAKAARSTNHPAHELHELGRAMAKELDRCESQVRQREEEQRRDLLREAHDAASEVKKAAKRVEKAQERNGVPERQYERDYLHAELSAERLLDAVSDLGSIAAHMADDRNARVDHQVHALREQAESGIGFTLNGMTGKLRVEQAALQREEREEEAREAAERAAEVRAEREKEARKGAERAAKERARREKEARKEAERDESVSSAEKVHIAAEQRAMEAIAKLREHNAQLQEPENVYAIVEYVRQCANDTVAQQHPAHELHELGRAMAKALRRCRSQAHKREETERRTLVQTARHAAKEAKKAAKQVERAQRRDGVQQRRYESDYLRAELFAEHLQDAVSDLGSTASRLAEDHNALVDRVVSALEEQTGTSRSQTLGDIEERLRQAEERLKAEARAKQQAKAAAELRARDETRKAMEVAEAREKQQKQMEKQQKQIVEERVRRVEALLKGDVDSDPAVQAEKRAQKAHEDKAAQAKISSGGVKAAEQAILKDQAMEHADAAATRQAVDVLTTTTTPSPWLVASVSLAETNVGSGMGSQPFFVLVAVALLASIGTFALRARRRHFDGFESPPLLG